MADEPSVIEPNVSSVQFKGSVSGQFSAIADRLSGSQLFTVSAEADSAIVFRVESRDMQKNPFLFFVMTFAKDGVTLQYSTPKDTSEKLRRLSVLSSFMSVLSMLSGIYTVDQKALLEYADSAIDDVLTSISQNYSSLLNSYDSLLMEHRELRKLNIELNSSNKSLSAQAAGLGSENESLKARLKALENYSDESLMVMVQEWIETHNSTIDIGQFSDTYKVAQPRIEQILNKMVSLGYLELKG
jgi:hypothetical protein